MNRRNLLAALSSSSAVGLAGCTGLVSSDSDSESSSGSGSTQGTTQEPNPQVSWSEEWIEGSSYRVNVTVQLDGAEEILVKKGSIGGETVGTITSGGEHTVFGPNTEAGAVESLQSIALVRPRESGVNQPVGTFVVGSQVQIEYPVHLGGLSGNTFPNFENETTLSRTFIQQPGDQQGRVLSLEVPEGLYRYYKNRERTRNYGAYVSDTYDDQYIENIVGEYEEFGNQQGLADYEVINEMMRFVQNLEYTSDQVSAGYNEYPKYPVETLVDREGDCEDSAILLASMLEEFGYGTVLLKFLDQQHMAVGIAGDPGLGGTYYEQNGRRYYYTETTAPGWGIGELPPDMEVGNPTLSPINDSGVLVFSYAVNATEGGAAVEVFMSNVGDGTGTGQVEVAFENENRETVASGSTESRQLNPEEEYTTTLNMLPPDDQTLRANITGRMNGNVQYTLQSEWRDPVSPPSDG